MGGGRGAANFNDKTQGWPDGLESAAWPQEVEPGIPTSDSLFCESSLFSQGRAGDPGDRNLSQPQPGCCCRRM